MPGLSLGAQFTDGHVSWGRPGHSHPTHHTHRSEGSGHQRRLAANQAQDSVAVNGDAAQGTIKQALVNQISATLTQRFELRQSRVAVAGATADEQAGNDLAGAVSSALNSLSGTPPTAAVAAVNDAATGAIQQTAQALPPGASAGAPSGLDTAVSRIKDQLQSLYAAYLANADSAQGGGSVAATGATLISNAKGMLEIHTREGDTITLGFASKSGVSVQDLQAGNGGAQLGSSDVQAFSKSRVTISVQGDLNAGELQAVRDLVGQVNQVADGFFAGDVSAALSRASGLNFDSSQLADYSLHLALKQTFAAYGLNLNLSPVASADQTPAPARASSAATAADTQQVAVAAPLADTGADAAPAGDGSTTTVDPVAANDGAAGDAKTAVAGLASPL